MCIVLYPIPSIFLVTSVIIHCGFGIPFMKQVDQDDQGCSNK